MQQTQHCVAGIDFNQDNLITFKKKMGTKSWAAVILTSFIFSQPFPRAARPSEAATYEINFNDQLKISGDLRLSERKATKWITFMCASNWRPLEGSTFHLFVHHSPNVDDDRSFLTVNLNYGLLRTIRLDQSNQKLTEIVIPLPPDLLKTENELKLSVDQFPEDGVSEEIWTGISSRSHLQVRYQEQEPDLDLGVLPLPLLDPYSYRPKRLDILLPIQSHTATLEATALTVANLCNRIAPEPVFFNFVRSTRETPYPVIMVGTPKEHPELGQVLGGSNFSLHKGPNRSTIVLRDGTLVGERNGVIGLAAPGGSPGKPVLYISGNSPAGVWNAAANLFHPETQFSGASGHVSKLLPPARARSRDWKGFIPPESQFTLDELALDDLSLDERQGFVLSIPLNSTPDAHFLDYEPYARLTFKFDRFVHSSDSQIVLQLNDTVIGRYDIRKLSDQTRPSLAVRIPARLLDTENVLKIALRGQPQDLGLRIAGFLLPSSTFYLPREYEVRLPDLSLLPADLFPLSVKGNLSDVIILLPNEIPIAFFKAVIELSGAFGRLAPSDHLAFKIRHLAELSDKERQHSHLVFLHTPEHGPPPENIFPGWVSLPEKSSVRKAALIQQAISPWNPEKVILSVSSNSAASLPITIRRLFSKPVLEQLRGDTAIISNEQIQTFDLMPKRILRDSSYLAHLEAWLRANWIALPLIVAAVSGILFVGLRLILNQYKKTHAQTH